MRLPPLIQAMRPEQWTKNAIVGAAWVFAFGDQTQSPPQGAWLRVGLAMFCFCLISSAVYLMNDLVDRELDQAHPGKKSRPIASGRLSPRKAFKFLLLLAGLPLVGAMAFSLPLATVLTAYMLLQVAYSLFLKTIPIVDVLVLSAGFVLRALAGAVVIPVHVSPWLLGCTFTLALFLALCKRHHEKSVLRLKEDIARPSLRNITAPTLNRLIDISIIATGLCYLAYTLSADTQAKYGDRRMLFTFPWVAYGILRYRRLVHKNQQGGRPEKQLFADRHLIAAFCLYVLTLLILFQVPN